MLICRKKPPTTLHILSEEIWDLTKNVKSHARNWKIESKVLSRRLWSEYVAIISLKRRPHAVFRPLARAHLRFNHYFDSHSLPSIYRSNCPTANSMSQHTNEWNLLPLKCIFAAASGLYMHTRFRSALFFSLRLKKERA